MKNLFYTFSCFAASIALSFAQEEKPLFTFSCFTDIHNQNEMISASHPDDVRLRTAFLQSLLKVKETEKIDAIVLGGDYSSDVTIPVANWEKMRQLMAEATQHAFPDEAKQKPVIYAIGNHDYEVANFDKIPKPYNAGDFYTFPMREQIGELSDADCFYEEADNGELGKQRLLTAYHYVIKGFDFVVLNCGKHYFKSAWDYQNSMESVAWVEAKLAELTAQDPQKTIFFIHHLPLPTSKGATAGKTLLSSAPSTKKLTKVLAQYPHLIYLYGHDHSSNKNKSFIERDLKQRITHYDTHGNVYVPEGEEEEAPEVTAVSIQAYAASSYLGFDTHNLSLTAEPHRFVATASALAPHTFNLFGDNAPTNNNGYIYCGSGGKFSGNSTASDKTALHLYEVDPTAVPLVAHRATTLEMGKHYAFACKSSAGGYYLLTDEVVSPGSTGQRLKGIGVNLSDEITVPSLHAVWTVNAYSVSSSTSPETAPPIYLITDAQGAYLDFSGNLTTLPLSAEDAEGFDIQPSTLTTAPYAHSKAVTLKINSSGGQYVHCGSGGKFSANSTIGSGNTGTALWLYVVEGTQAKKVDQITPGKHYLIVGQRSGKYYQLLNTNNGESGNSLRMLSQVLSITAPVDEFVYNENPAALWHIAVKTPTVQEPGDPSFLSCFMGSMRYNSFDTNASPGIEDSPVVQAMMVYVYSDRIVLSMKNYGRVGTVSGNAVQATLEDPIPDYVIRRNVNPVGIQRSLPSQSPQQLYDLSGRQVSQPRQGLYIVNGQKTLVR